MPFRSCCAVIKEYGTFLSLVDDAMKKILKDQEEFEKEHQFMQVWV